MTLNQENSSKCFKRLLAESNSPKFHKSLEHIRKACNAIENMKGQLNYSRIATYTEEHFGTPKKQSILNCKRLKLYIEIRKHEYAATKEKPPKSKEHLSEPPYPSSDLDLKTKVYIDHLRSKVKQQELSIRYLNEEILEKTSKQPISFIESISQGPGEDLSMELTRSINGKETESYIDHTLKKAISKLLAMVHNPNIPLEVQKKNEKHVIVLETETVKETILFEDEIAVLEKIISTQK